MHATVIQVDFKASAIRHFDDAALLESHNRLANAGQLYGLTAECGLKALMVKFGEPVEANGDLLDKSRQGYRKHMPSLGRIISNLTIFPDGRDATRYLSMLSSLSNFDDWLIDHRYWKESTLPTGSVTAWALAAKEVMLMLDEAFADGVTS